MDIKRMQFQYNFCYCSIHWMHDTVSLLRVSIQLLLLFYLISSILYLLVNRFNTTFVTVLF